MSRAILRCALVWCVALVGGSALAAAPERPVPAGETPRPLQVGGVFPRLAVSTPDVPGSESGIGALMPWADRLWMVTYVAHIKGEGTGLFEITPDFRLIKRPESVVGTFANRMIHVPSKQCIIGPHFIDLKRNVRTCNAIKSHRLTATMTHLEDPKKKVYFLTMEGLLFEVDVQSLEARRVADVKKELGIRGKCHFKGGFTGAGRVVVANNSYDEQDVLGKGHDGRLAEWDGKKWTILARTAFCEVMGNRNTIFATGWDPTSARPLHRVAPDTRGRDRAVPHAHARHVLRTLDPDLRGLAVGPQARLRPPADHPGLLLVARPDGPGRRPGRRRRRQSLGRTAPVEPAVP